MGKIKNFSKNTTMKILKSIGLLKDKVHSRIIAINIIYNPLIKGNKPMKYLVNKKFTPITFQS
jgi:hypothetical protein